MRGANCTASATISVVLSGKISALSQDSVRTNNWPPGKGFYNSGLDARGVQPSLPAQGQHRIEAGPKKGSIGQNIPKAYSAH